jgi:tRNA threonylcarbamoyl adenosine modification protein YeaZ
MISLFLDTSSKTLSVYIVKDNAIIYEKNITTNNDHSKYLVPSIDEGLKLNNLKPSDVNKCYVVTGPGSFTGTRIGVTIAKTLAYANNIDIVSLTSLDLIGLNLDNESYVGVLENNGAFVCKYNKEIISDIKYYKLSEYNVFKEENKVVDNIELDDNKLINFINKLDVNNAHEVNPLYVKNIEGLK